ncbi:MAG: hypothetical protein M0P31_13805 [Solirubrobacteraceae bacterium]|nr:hypothetical protein [Solirubrobacteraceae bacterium]
MIRRFALPTSFLAALATVALLAAPATGTAARSATKAERAAIAKASKVPASCIRVRVSTRNSRWAAWSLRFPVRKSCIRAADRQPTWEIAVYLKRTGKRWKRAGSASQCARPARLPRRIWSEMAPACRNFDDEGLPL